MSIDNYLTACRRLRRELVESLSSDEVEQLRAMLEGISAVDWGAWYGRNQPHVEAFARATPSERLRKKAWKDPLDRLPLTLAAIHHLESAEALLTAIDHHGIAPGGSYRETASAAGSAFLDLLRAKGEPWPFPGKSPFRTKT